MEKKIRMPLAPVFLIIACILDVIYSCIIQKPSFFTILSLIVDLALCYALFTKRRDVVLVGILGANAIVDLISLLLFFSIGGFLTFAATAILFLFALSVCEKSPIQGDFSKIKEYTEKFYYLPAALYLLSFVINFFRPFGLLFGLLPLIYRALSLAFLFTLGTWLKDPYEKEMPVKAQEASPNTEEDFGEGYCPLGKHVLLYLFTFGIWTLIWTYRTTKFLNKAPGAQYYNPTNKLLLCIFVPFYQIFWFYKHGQRIDSLSKEKNLATSDMATLCLILGIFIPLVAYIIMQDRINAICTASGKN